MSNPRSRTGSVPEHVYVWALTAVVAFVVLIVLGAFPQT
jgi:hypothetical protein